MLLASQDSTTLFFSVLAVVKAEFQLKDSYLRDDVPTFIIPPVPQVKERVERLRAKLKPRGLEVSVRRSDGDFFLQVMPLQMRPARSRSFFGLSLPLLLFILTVVTVSISGYLTSESYVYILRILGRLDVSSANLYVWELTILYTVSIMAIIGLHELGHLVACRIHHVEASLPIFIPGIPGLTPGTFGAVIIEREPAFNRDQLFDVGIMGPLVGFIVSIIVSAIGYSLSIPVSSAEFLYVSSKIGQPQLVSPPVLFLFIGQYLFPNPMAYTHFFHPMAVAGWVGTLITFLNIFPISQLDGGHVSRAVLGEKWHNVLSYLMIGVMILAGWWTMAILVMLFITAKHPGTLDDVSDLSKNRKIAALLFIVIFVSCFTFSSDSPLWSLLFR